MLSPSLRRLKNQIESKREHARSISERELLADLASLDRNAEFKKALLSEGIEDRAFAGTPDGCQCCGRPF
jgi:hypothetical protein